jgi:hypothetical protein
MSQEPVDRDIASFAGKGRCFTQYALLREPQALGNAPAACVVRGGLKLDTMQAERTERVVEDGRDGPGDQSAALEPDVGPSSVNLPSTGVAVSTTTTDCTTSPLA